MLKKTVVRPVRANTWFEQTLEERGRGCGIYRLDLATRSSSSFFLMAYELDEPLAALINSSARHSAIDLTLRKADSRVCVDKERQ